ncbi:hypothetical protein BDV34DRAFT_106056 [Aspergillus parasiticus]|uniref:Secreted protein n=1 Tax=Aspergillus parasiticus TaxID=5067 RepID=A0A5N6DJ05_ASPPA|nr:hypothetical protein BDV34DRAFT_106056 [Aspergillus parasiticus]
MMIDQLIRWRLYGSLRTSLVALFWSSWQAQGANELKILLRGEAKSVMWPADPGSFLTHRRSIIVKSGSQSSKKFQPSMKCGQLPPVSQELPGLLPLPAALPFFDLPYPTLPMPSRSGDNNPQWPSLTIHGRSYGKSVI